MLDNSSDYNTQRAMKKKSAASFHRGTRAIRNMLPQDVLCLVRYALSELEEIGPDYSAFQSAQGTNKAIKQAARALEGRH